MADILIRGMEMPTDRRIELLVFPSGHVGIYDVYGGYLANARAVPLPEKHGRLIDADAIRAKMYHEAFETDTPMQKWDSGCWIRYKMFERMEESAPTIIEAEGGGEDG